MTVSIDIDLDAMDALQGIGNLKLALKSLEEDLDLDLDIDGDLDGMFDDLTDSMEELFESFDSDLNETIDRLEGLDVDIGGDVDRGGGDSGGDTGSDSGDHVPSARQFFSDGVLENERDNSSGIRQALNRIGNTASDINDFSSVVDRLDEFERPDSSKYTPYDGRNYVGDYDFDFGFGDSDEDLQSLFRQFSLNEDGIKGRMRAADGSDGDSSWSMNRMLQKANSMAGMGDFESMIKSINDDRNFGNEEASRVQTRINDLFEDDFDFTVDQELTNDMQNRGRNGIFGQSDMGTMSLEEYRTTRDTDSVELGGSLGSSDDDSDYLTTLTRKMQRLKGTSNDLKRRFKGLVPSMSTWINLVGAAVPALAVMAVQAGAVAAAMGSMAVAGAGIIGLGLIGHGETMAESFRNAGNEVDDLKKALFEEFQPSAELFSGVQAEFFDFIPGQMTRVNNSMEGLLVFKDDLFDLFRGGAEFASRFIDIIVENEAIISNLTKTFAKLTGAAILDFFEWLLTVGSENEEMLKSFGKIIKRFASTLYNLFMIIGRALVMLTPVFKLFNAFAKLLNNQLVSGVVAIVVVLYMLSSALGIVGGAMGIVASIMSTGLIPLFSSMFIYLSSYIFQTLAATAASYGLAASIANVTAALGTLLAMSGVGLILAGLGTAVGGMLTTQASDYGTPTGGSGSGGGTTINEGDTVNVDIGNASTSSIEKFQDMGSSGGSRGPTGGSYTSD